MNAEIVGPGVDAGPLAALDTAALRAELSRSLARTADELRRLAAIVRLLEERGEDLSDLRIGLLGYLRQIAHGQMLPEVVVRFAEAPDLCRRVASLPLPDQARLAAGEPVRLVVRRGDGAIDHRLVDPLLMTRHQVYQAFGPRRLRDEAEQVNVLDGASSRPVSPARPRVGRVSVDREKGTLRIGRTSVPAADVVAALAAIRAGDERDAPSGNDVSVVPVKLTRAEHERLKHAAVGTTQQDLVRRALIAAGLI